MLGTDSPAAVYARLRVTQTSLIFYSPVVWNTKASAVVGVERNNNGITLLHIAKSTCRWFLVLPQIIFFKCLRKPLTLKSLIEYFGDW